MSNFHKSVLLRQVIDYLEVKPGNKYIDVTLGGGGHTIEILERGGRVLGIDVDEDALEYVRKQFEISNFTFQIGKELILVKGNFRDIGTIARSNGFEKTSGIIADLGVSSFQLEKAEKGFSFQKEGSLDMRMDKALSVKAADLINALTKGELYELFTKLGEEHSALAISNSIVRARGVKPIETTTQLAQIIEKTVGRKIGKIHPATKVFQALRIAVNDELNSLREFIPRSVEILSSGGRLAIISFHSLEDRIVKQTFKELEERKYGTVVTNKPIVPTQEEVDRNIRSRSAKLRVFSAKG